MALDISRFAKVFFEEAYEHLGALESLLVGINLQRPDNEALNAIFRAVHSVKGGAAAFGHSALAEFTHELESILDRVRKGTLALSRPLIDISLTASDVMRQHLAALEKDRAPDVLALQKVQTSLAYLANELSHESSNAQAAASTTGTTAIDQMAAITSAIAAVRADVTNKQQSSSRFQISIRLEKSRYGSESALAELKRDIAGLGNIVNASSHDVDDNSLLFSFGLDTDIDADELTESMEFLVPTDALEISASSTGGPSAATGGAAGDDLDFDDSFGFFDDLEQEIPSAIVPKSAPIGTFGNTGAETDIQLASLSDSTSIRVNVEKIDQLINLVGELVIAESMVTQGIQNLAPELQANMTAGLTQFQRNTRELQDAVLAIRMLPISFVFARLPRLTRDVCQRTGKEIDLDLFGEDTELDKSVIEKIADPLTHLVRKAVDHGIELPEVRSAKNKRPVGRLTVRAAHIGGNIVISVIDDGAGLNRHKILAKAREMNMEVDENWPDEDVWPLIFTPGFSTAAAVTDISGRGVGMDVVWKNVHAIGGRVSIASVADLGTTVTIKLPLTLAILDGMSITSNNNIFILPLANIIQSMQPGADDIETVSGHSMVMVRDEYVPILSLNDIFNIPKSHENTSGIVIIVEFDNKRAALRVDDLLGQHQVVLKSLEANYQKTRGVSGATILGDGRVALILDAEYIVSIAHSVNKGGTSHHAH